MASGDNLTIGGPNDGVGSGSGYFPASDTDTVFNRTGAALALGEVVMMDHKQSATECTNSIPGDSASVYRNVVVPTTAGLDFAYFGLVVGLGESVGADDTEVDVMWRGRAPGSIAGAVLVGVQVTGANGVVTLTDTIGAGFKVIAVMEEAATGAGSFDVLFDGINGFGTG